MELSETDGGSIMEYAEQDRCFLVRSVYRTAPGVVERLRSIRIDVDQTLVGRAARERRPIAVADLAAVPLDPHLQILFDDGWRSLAAVPMLREGEILGSLIVRRGTPARSSPRRHWTSWRPSPASRPWPCRTPSSTVS